MRLQLDPPEDAVTQRSFLRRLRDVAVAIFGALVLYLTVLVILYNVSHAHWAFGVGATIFYAAAVSLGLSDLHGDWARRLPVHRGIGLVLLLASTGIAVAASASFQLLRAGWALYEPAPDAELAYLIFNYYYLWVLLDLLPGLDAAKTLSLPAPLMPANWVAGLPVVGFRAFIIFGILAGLRVWWTGKRTAKKVADSPARSTQGDV